jgi:hypothetical protein
MYTTPILATRSCRMPDILKAWQEDTVTAAVLHRHALLMLGQAP